jgi:hypothetical protein
MVGQAVAAVEQAVAVRVVQEFQVKVLLVEHLTEVVVVLVRWEQLVVLLMEQITQELALHLPSQVHL